MILLAHIPQWLPIHDVMGNGFQVGGGQSPKAVRIALLFELVPFQCNGNPSQIKVYLGTGIFPEETAQPAPRVLLSKNKIMVP